MGAGPLPHPRVSQEPLHSASPMSQGHLGGGAAHPPWSPGALAVFWVLEAMGENHPASSLDLLFLAWLEGASPGVTDP